LTQIITEAAALIGVVKTALQGLSGMWIVYVPAGMFCLGLGVKFLFGLMGRGKKRRR
jgi:hypothetical protein